MANQVSEHRCGGGQQGLSAKGDPIMYEKQIEQLVVLQKVDDEIILLEAEIDQAPKDVAALEARHETLEKRKQQLDEKLDLLKEQKKNLKLRSKKTQSRSRKVKVS